MPLLTVLSPARAGGLAFIDETYASLVAQRMPDGWDWEWVLQIDDLDAALPAGLSDPRVRVGHGPRGGPSVARNLGLARATGSLVRNVDVDDVLLPGALARDVLTLDDDPTLGWVTSAAVDLGPDEVPDGQGGAHAYPAGRIRRGMVRRWVTEHQWALPVHPTTLCARRDLVLALGGWTALPSGGDTALLLALDAVSDGHFLDQPSVHYRKHPDQITAQPLHSRPDLLAARRALSLDRARALSELGWQYP